ncbi:MAG: hypothetical protein LBD35_07700 [Prevotellaceae bacterium]|jgi:hypothetical protein|nr:hypothetical protein [Prevotellaceae bacterium]
MKTFILSLLLVFAYATVCADGGLYLFPKGARAAGTGGNGLLAGDIWSAYNNQAGLAFVDKPSAGVYYENRFLVERFGINAGVFTLPALAGTFGMTMAYTGIEDYGETRIGIGYGKRLASKLAMGIQLNYHLQSFASGHPSLYAFTGEVGLIAEPAKNILIGVHVFNPTFSKLNSKYEDPVQVILTAGAGYVTEKLAVSAEVEKKRTGDPIPRFGIEYALFRKIRFRSGVGLNPVTIHFGAGWNTGKFLFDFAFSHHETLGFSPQIGVGYRFR